MVILDPQVKIADVHSDKGNASIYLQKATIVRFDGTSDYRIHLRFSNIPFRLHPLSKVY